MNKSKVEYLIQNHIRYFKTLLAKSAPAMKNTHTTTLTFCIWKFTFHPLAVAASTVAQMTVTAVTIIKLHKRHIIKGKVYK